MWLPKGERTLLLAYFLEIGEPDKEGWYKEHNLVNALKVKSIKKSISVMRDYSKNSLTEESAKQGLQNKNDISLLENAIKDYINYLNRVYTANSRLAKRKLVTTKIHQVERDFVGISLTLEGWDLARKYTSWFGKTGEWWKENKGHWVWVLLGIIFSFITGWLTAKLT